MPTARCLWFVAPGRVEIAAEELPPVAAGQVLVRTLFSGISSGTELLAFRGELDPTLAADETIGALDGTFSFPFRYGYSCVGVIEESRSALSNGALVFAFHPHQDRFVASATDVVPLGAVQARPATIFPLVETALQIALDAGPLLGETVVVMGLGVVGTLTSLMLQRAGARVIAVEMRAWRRAVAESLGVVAVAPDGLVKLLSSEGRDGLVPLVVEASGSPDALRFALGVLEHEGTVLVASWYGTKEVSLPLGKEFHRRRLTVRSTQVSTIPAELSSRWNRDRRRRTVVDLLGRLPLENLSTHTFAFEEAAEAYGALDEGREGLVHAALGYQ